MISGRSAVSRSGGRILVLAGKGHNGGDALLAARQILADRLDATVVVVLGFGPEELRPLAGRALDWLRQQAPERVKIEPLEVALATGQQYTRSASTAYSVSSFACPHGSGQRAA